MTYIIRYLMLRRGALVVAACLVAVSSSTTLSSAETPKRPPARLGCRLETQQFATPALADYTGIRVLGCKRPFWDAVLTFPAPVHFATQFGFFGNWGIYGSGECTGLGTTKLHCGPFKPVVPGRNNGFTVGVERQPDGTRLSVTLYAYPSDRRQMLSLTVGP